MAREYSFNDVVQYSGASANELKHWVQTGLIRADIRESTGTGAHRTFGFLDVFEACIARACHQIPGGMPIDAIYLALEAVRWEAAQEDDPHSAWVYLDKRHPSDKRRRPGPEAILPDRVVVVRGRSPVPDPLYKVPPYWSHFLDPITRDEAAHFWLRLEASGPTLATAAVVNRQELDRSMERFGTLVTIRLDSTLRDLEGRTQDHSTEAERRRAWSTEQDR